MEKLEMYQNNVFTYTSKFNSYGNRLTLTVNHIKKIYMFSGCHQGDYGTLEENLLQKEIKAIEKDLIQKGYDHVRNSLHDNYGYPNAITQE